MLRFVCVFTIAHQELILHPCYPDNTNFQAKLTLRVWTRDDHIIEIGS